MSRLRNELRWTETTDPLASPACAIGFPKGTYGNGSHTTYMFLGNGRLQNPFGVSSSTQVNRPWFDGGIFV